MQPLDKKETVNSLLKSAFSLIPFAGTALTELLIEYNGRIKQNRLNRFVELLYAYFEKNQNAKIDNIKTEDFNDLFESVLKKVIITKSDEKIKRFRDIIIKELNNPSKETELTAIYLDLIEMLSEEEIIILDGLSNFNQDYYDQFDKQSHLKSELLNLKTELKSKPFLQTDENYVLSIKILQDQIDSFLEIEESLKKFSEAKYYKLTETKFTFYKQRLFSKGLLIDEGVGRLDTKSFEMMMITDFGKEFISFIKTETAGNTQ